MELFSLSFQKKYLHLFGFNNFILEGNNDIYENGHLRARKVQCPRMGIDVCMYSLLYWLEADKSEIQEQKPTRHWFSSPVPVLDYFIHVLQIQDTFTIQARPNAQFVLAYLKVKNPKFEPFWSWHTDFEGLRIQKAKITATSQLLGQKRKQEVMLCEKN